MDEDTQFAGVIMPDDQDDELAESALDEVAGVIVQEAGGDPESA